MLHVTSKDGTSIAYERMGNGPAVILTGDHSENAPLASQRSRGRPLVLTGREPDPHMDKFDRS
jgi:hypothetical protein